MSSRHILTPQLVMKAASLTADAFSVVTNINGLSICSYSISWTGTPTGTFNIEVCNDYVPTSVGIIPTDPQSGSWVALTLTNTISAAGSPSTAFADIDTCGAAWIRIHYVHSSSTGTATATIAGKSA